MPQDTFIVSKSELDTVLEIGETGIIMVPVEVISIDKENYVLRKDGRITPEGQFKPESVKSMRDNIGTVDDEIAPVNTKE